MLAARASSSAAASPSASPTPGSTGAAASPGARASYFDLYPERRGQGPYAPPKALLPRLQAAAGARSKSSDARERRTSAARRAPSEGEAQRSSGRAAQEGHPDGAAPPQATSTDGRAAPRTPGRASEATSADAVAALPPGRAPASLEAHSAAALPPRTPPLDARAYLLSSGLPISTRSRGAAATAAARAALPPVVRSRSEHSLAASGSSSSSASLSGMSSSSSAASLGSGVARQWHARAATRAARDWPSPPVRVLPVPKVHAAAAATPAKAHDAPPSRAQGSPPEVDRAAQAAAQRHPNGYPGQVTGVTRRRSAQNIVLLARSQPAREPQHVAPDSAGALSRATAGGLIPRAPRETHSSPPQPRSSARRRPAECTGSPGKPRTATMPAPADSVLPRYSDAEGMARVRAKEAATQERWRRVREQVDAQKERERRREEEERQASSRDSEWISTDADMSRGSSAQGLAPPARLAGDVPLSINEIIRRGSEGLRIAPRGCVGADSPASPSTLQRSPRLDLRAAAAGAAADVPATYAASSHALGRDLPHTPRSARVPVRSINDIINGIPLPPAALRSDASAANQSDATPRLRTISAAASDDGTLSDASESSVDSVGREVRETLRASQLINPQTRTHRSLLKDRRDAAASPTLELPDTHRLHHATSFPTRPARNQTPSPQLGASEFGALQKPPVYARKSAPGSANASVRNRTLSNISVASANARLASSQTPRSAEAAPPVPSLSASEDASVSSFIRSSKLTRVVTLSRAPYAGLRVSLADVGDPVGHPVVVFLGLGAVRYLVGLYDEMAAAMGLRLICVDRWGMGRTDDLPSERRGVLLWSGVVHEVADELGLSRFSVLAHSAGAPYAMATCLTSSPGTIAGPAHLLAPWVGAEVESGYKWLKYVPDGIIKTAQAAEWRMQGWKLGKLPTLQTDTPPLGTAASRKGRGSQEPSSSDPPMSPHDASQNAADVSLDAALKTPTLNVPSPVLSSTRPLKQKSSKTGLFGGIFGATNGPQSPRRSPTPSTPATPALPDASALSSPRQTAAPSAFASIAARSEMPTWESSSSLAGSAGAARLDTSPAASRDARPSLDGVPKLTARRSLRVLKRSASGVDVTAAASVPADPSQGSKVTRRSSVMGPADGARGSSAGSTALSSPAALSFPAFQDGSGPSTPTHAASSSSSVSSATTRGGSSGPASDLPTALLRASHAESLAGGTADLLTILGRSSQRPWGFSYPDVRHPVLVWHGDRDERISLASAQWMEREMADCTVRVVKGAGHGLMTNIDVVVSALESIASYRDL